VSVALRAAALLAPEAGMCVLDLGAGPGKLCCVGALARGGRWHGIEREPSLVAAAIATARWLEVDHCTSFAVGDMTQLDWGRFDSLYFYNPFEAQLFGYGVGDPAGAVGVAEQVASAEQRLSELAPGVRVVTFHGFGGAIPPCFARTWTEVLDDGELALWVKRPHSRARNG
jgi:hypothetical protein